MSEQNLQDSEALKAGVEAKFRSGANWFYWIAGLSVVNTILSTFQTDRVFVLGLGYSLIVDGFAAEAGSGGKAVPITISLLIAGVFALFGYFAGQKKAWGFWVGMPLYALDTIIFVLAGIWLGVAIHAYALYSLFTGALALKELLKLERTVVPGLSDVKLD